MKLDNVQTVSLKFDHLGCGLASRSASRISLGSVRALSVKASLHEYREKKKKRREPWLEMSQLESTAAGVTLLYQS